MIECEIANAIKTLKKEKGNSIFTAEEYKRLRKDMPSLETLIDNHLIRIDHSEIFVETVPNSSFKCYIYNNKNQIVMEWEEYKKLPRIAQEALIAINDEEAFEIKCPNEITIARKNYYYIADYDEMTNYIEGIKEYFFAKKEAKEQELIEINYKIKKLEEIFK